MEPTIFSDTKLIEFGKKQAGKTESIQYGPRNHYGEWGRQFLAARNFLTLSRTNQTDRIVSAHFQKHLREWNHFLKRHKNLILHTPKCFRPLTESILSFRLVSGIVNNFSCRKNLLIPLNVLLAKTNWVDPGILTCFVVTNNFFWSLQIVDSIHLNDSEDRLNWFCLFGLFICKFDNFCAGENSWLHPLKYSRSRAESVL